MKRPSSIIRRLFFVALVSLWPTLLWASEPEAEQFVRDRHGQLVTLLRQSKSSARDAKVSVSIDEVFDYEQLAARSLGEEWRNRSEAEQKQFRDLLTQLVRQTYRKSINTTLGYDVEYRGTRKSGDDTIVATVAKHKTDKRKASVSIDYVLVQASGGNWRAADVIIEGSSLVGNYRSQFTRVIRKSGFADLLEKMKRKVQKGE
jgi:phospholipid transport system substrate-binding protein